jgi:hypothetical protein
MPTSTAFPLVALLVLVAAFPARAWDELGTLEEARRAHPALFRKGAVSRIEVDGVEHWAFSGDSDRRDGFPVLSDTERYAEAALDARRNLLRHVTGGARNVTAEASGIVVAYRFPDGPARRVVCLVPVENVRVISAAAPDTSTAPPSASAAPDASDAPAAAESPTETSAPEPPSPSSADESTSPSPADAGLPRFSSPNLPTPVLP